MPANTGAVQPDPANPPNFVQQHDPFEDPTPGTFNTPTSKPDVGGDAPPSSKAVTPPTTGNDYTGWNWEQTLVGVLGLTLPSRDDVTNQMWTAINFNSPGGTGMYRIYAATWGNKKDTFVYLNPNLLQPGGALDNYIYVPKTALYNAVGTNPDYTGFPAGFDVRSFTTAAEAVFGVTYLYQQTDDTFKTLSDAVAGDQSAFKGQAGAAFAQLMSNLHKVADSAYQQIGVKNNYAQLISSAGDNASAFLLSLWDGIVNWWKMEDHNPLGAIYQALVDGGVTYGPVGGPYQLVNPNSVNSSFGDLTTAAAWQNVENAAKALWTASIKSALDPVAQQAINALANSFMTTAQTTQPLLPPTLQAISPGNPAGANPNVDPGGATGQFANLNDAPGGANPNLPGGANPNLPGGANNPMSALANTGGAGATNLPGGANNPMSALANPGGGPLGLPGGAFIPMSLLTNPGGGPLGLPGGANSPQLGSLESALGDNSATQAALQRALSLAPANGPLHNALTTALANSQKAGAMLQAALGGAIPAATALQNALASNGQAQNALQQALALAPAKGPLHNALQSALKDSNKTQSALNQALTSGSIPGTGPIHQALHSDATLANVLHKALSSSQVPSHGPLHDALTSAISQSGHVKSALNQALAGGATPNTPALNHALSSNTALQADLRKALGQAPAHGPLHNELMAALSDSKNVGTQIHQALAQAGIPAEPPPGMLSAGVGNPAGLGSLLGPNHGLTATLGAPGGGGAGGFSAGLGGGGAGVPGGGAGLPGGGAGVGLPGHTGAGVGATATPGLGNGAPGAPASTGRFVPSSAAGTPAANGTSAVPFFPPMAGMGGMGGAGQQQQERERTTWLAEDEDVWGTDPQIGPSVLGRDLLDDDEEFDSYDEFDEHTPQPERDRSRSRAR